LVAACFSLAVPAPAQTTAATLLARATQLLSTQPAESIKLLLQARQLDPQLPGLSYQLGMAYHAIGDEADAETELTDAVTATPASAEAHNYLGIARFQLGNAKGALEEFRTAAKLAPRDANAHFNLGEALARTGDSDAAIAELREAATLTPTDASLTRLLKSIASTTAGAIKVNVTQILVPAVVTDAAGHHITGLTQADFKILEDGVEQKITAFSAESTGLPQAPTAASNKSTAPPTPPTPRNSIRRTYLICIDTLHTSFTQFTAVRDSLIALFRQEHSADSQYVVIALGASPEMVVGMTTDPAAPIAVFQSKKFQKIFLDGQTGGLASEMESFRRDLAETRSACDRASDHLLLAKCAAGLDRATQRARQIAELDRTLTIGFLRQFRSLVTQLSKGRERRTILLVSPGFQIEPGREALAMVDAFFPPASHCLVPPDVFCPPSAMQSASRLADEFEPILKLAAATNITIHTIDSRGLYGQKAFDASSTGLSVSVGGAVDRVERNTAADQGNTLAEIANSTGGLHSHDTNDLLGSLQRAFADGREFYTLSYVSTNPVADGKFRAITVQVRDPHAVVNAKRGYWAQ
jgi:VWFA-related protein